MALRDDLTGGSSRTGHASQHNQLTDAVLKLQPLDRAIYAPAAAVATGGLVSWAAASTSHGRTLLTLPGSWPVVPIGGLYAITLALFVPFVSGKSMTAELNLDADNDDPTVGCTLSLDSAATPGGSGLTTARAGLSMTYYIPAGSSLGVVVVHDKSGTLDLGSSTNLIVQLLAEF